MSVRLLYKIGTMSDGPPSDELDSPESIQEILLSMDCDDLQALSAQLRESYDLLYEETTTGVVVAPPSDSPAPCTVRAAVICRDIAALLDTSADMS